MRTYPNGETACHVLGYLGKISESQQAEYLRKGYTSTDLIGKEGIESYYESVLKGSDGEKLIQVNAKGEQVEVISDSDPEPGDDVYLTIDLELQKTAEEALPTGAAEDTGREVRLSVNTEITATAKLTETPMSARRSR